MDCRVVQTYAWESGHYTIILNVMNIVIFDFKGHDFSYGATPALAIL